MAGYCEFSKSNNAIEAESGGLFPITKAVKIVSKATNCTRKKAREILNKIGADEYHHTSKFYNVTDYYDTAKAKIAEIMIFVQFMTIFIIQAR